MRTAGLMLLWLIGQMSPAVFGDESPAIPMESPTVPREVPTIPMEESSRLIRQLGSEDFADRRTARGELLKAGSAAIAVLRKGAVSPNETLVNECISLLSRQAHCEDEVISKQAEAALKSLAEGDNALTAGLAQAALKPSSPLPNAITAKGGRMGIQINIQARAGGIRPAGQPGGFQFQQMQIQIVNGQRTVEVAENGRSIQIRDNNGQDIQMEIKETVDGKETVRKAEAKNLEDLEKNDPDLAKLYKQHTKGVQLQIQPAQPK